MSVSGFGSIDLNQPSLNQEYRLQCGRRIGVAEIGGPHGMIVLDFYPAGSSRWIIALSDIPDGLRVICMDRPGIGLSEASDVTPTQFADDVADVLDKMGVSKVHVMACCCGAIYGLAFAVKHPSRVRNIFLLAPWVDPDLASASLRFVKHYVPMGLISAFGRISNQMVLTSFTSIVESTLLPAERVQLRPGAIAASRAVCEENGRRTAAGHMADLAACTGPSRKNASFLLSLAPSIPHSVRPVVRPSVPPTLPLPPPPSL